MFERFTDRARRTLVLAQEEARSLGHAFIGTEHLLLGLLAEGEGVGAKVLHDLGVELDAIRTEVRAAIGPSETADVPEKPPFTPRSKKVLELALREALELRHNYIGTEHLLLALAREGEGVGAQLLVKRGIDAGTMRERVLGKLAMFQPPLGAPRRRPVAPDNHTPAVAAIVPAAEALAGAGPVGSHHLLLATLDQVDSLAARALASFGVTREAVAERCNDLGVAGTTDEVPKPEPFTIHTFEGGITIRIEDAELAAKIRSGELTVTFKPAT